MERQRIERYIRDFQEKTFQPRERETKPKESQKIQTVIGARRVGKTYVMYNKIKELEAGGISRKQMIFINFESPLLSELSFKEVRDIIEIHWSLYPESIHKKLYLFVDEPQVIKNWELAIRDIYDNYDCRIFITGSSSKLLSKEIATSLRGRSISIQLLPLSFKEFLTFKDFNFKELSTKSKAQLMAYFEEYLSFGGYPEIVLEPDKNNKLKILKDYFDLVVFKDLVERHNIKNTKLIKILMGSVIDSISKEFSLNKLYLTLKSQGMEVSKNTLYEYFSILEDSFFIFTLRKTEDSKRKEEISIPKVYLDDIGFLNLFSMEEYGRRIENIIFLHLIRKINENPLLKINYFKTIDGKEVDFIISEGKKFIGAIQSCYDTSENRTEEREISPLLTALKRFNLKEGIILTKDESKEITINGKKIKFIPLWKWLIEN